MLKKSITFTDYNGNTITEDYYFNLNKVEVMEMELVHPEGLKGWIERIVRIDDRQELIRMFHDIILQAYGEKDESGRRFIKSEEMRKAFEQSEAFSELYMELITDENAAAEFMNGIIPKMENQDKPVLATAQTM